MILHFEAAEVKSTVVVILRLAAGLASRNRRFAPNNKARDSSSIPTIPLCCEMPSSSLLDASAKRELEPAIKFATPAVWVLQNYRFQLSRKLFDDRILRALRCAFALS